MNPDVQTSAGKPNGQMLGDVGGGPPCRGEHERAAVERAVRASADDLSRVADELVRDGSHGASLLLGPAGKVLEADQPRLTPIVKRRGHHMLDDRGRQREPAADELEAARDAQRRRNEEGAPERGEKRAPGWLRAKLDRRTGNREAVAALTAG
jgi:hypothetical protein